MTGQMTKKDGVFVLGYCTYSLWESNRERTDPIRKHHLKTLAQEGFNPRIPAHPHGSLTVFISDITYNSIKEIK